MIGGRPFRPLDADMRWIGALCYRNGVIEETGLAAGVLNHPANGIAWLVRKLSGLDSGARARPRSCSLGSFIRPLEAGKGDTIQADYGAYGNGELPFRLSSARSFGAPHSAASGATGAAAHDHRTPSE